MRRLFQIPLIGGIAVVILFLSIRVGPIFAFIWASMVVVYFLSWHRKSITPEQVERIPSGLLTLVLLLGAITFWTLYWNFEQILWEPPRTSPTLEMSTIGAACVAGITAIVIAVALSARGADRHWLARYLVLPDIPLLCCVYLLIYLRYGVIPPLVATNAVDFVVTVILLYVVVSSVMGFIVEQVWSATSRLTRRKTSSRG
jgi:hypothetical protein